MTTPPRRRTVLHEEQLETAIAELTKFADEQADAMRKKNRDQGRLYRFNPSKLPPIDAALRAQLRSALEDEVVPAIETEGSTIRPIEFGREVIKKALVSLKTEALKNIARRSALEVKGGIEDLATRIAEQYGWNQEEIARLILENEPEPSEERSHSDRLFPLTEAPSMDYVSDRLEYVLGRYIRIGIARWFVFEELDSRDSQLILRGTLRAYRADVTEIEDTPSVIAVARDDRQVEVLIDESVLLRVRRGNATESSAAVSALKIAAQIEPLGKVPLRTSGITAGAAVAFAPASLFMLDLLTARFDRAGLHDKNLTVARFQMDDPSETVDNVKPRLRAVRFEGAHLLDSPPACKLLAEEGRALVDMSMTVQTAPRPDGEAGRFPVRVAIERDHILALTGFGTLPGLSFGVQAAVVEAVSAELSEGLADPEGVADLAIRIEERARISAPIERADMLHDDADDMPS